VRPVAGLRHFGAGPLLRRALGADARQHRLGTAANLALHASYTAEGITNHGEQWLREIGRDDLVQWARSKEMRGLTVHDLRI